MVIRNEDLHITFISEYEFKVNNVLGCRMIADLWVEKSDDIYKMCARTWQTHPEITTDEEAKTIRYSNGKRAMFKIEGHWCMLVKGEFKKRTYQDDAEMQGAFNKFVKAYMKGCEGLIPNPDGKGCFKGNMYDSELKESKVMFRRNTIKKS